MQASRPLFAEVSVHPMALENMAQFQADVVREVSDAVAREPVVVVGMAWNPHVSGARRALRAAGIAYRYLGYGNYIGGWRKRLAIKLWSGWPTFPQVFVRGTLIGGASDLKRALADGTVQRLLGAPPTGA